jgi:hypothetical protein
MSKDLRPLMANGKRFSMGPVLRDLQSSSKKSPGQSRPAVETVYEEQEVEDYYPQQHHTPFRASSASPLTSPAAESQDSLHIDEMKRDLDVARMQIGEVTRESQEVLRMLKESASVISTNMNTVNSTTAALSKAQKQQVENARRSAAAAAEGPSPKKGGSVASTAVELAKLKEQTESNREQIERLEGEYQ